MTKLTKIKKGVDFKGIMTYRQLKIMLAVMEEWEFDNRIPVITSAVEGRHMRKSKHYTGEALDYRIYYLTHDEKHDFLENMTEALGDDYDVVMQKDHLHIEYDPKKVKKSPKKEERKGKAFSCQDS